MTNIALRIFITGAAGSYARNSRYVFEQFISEEAASRACNGKGAPTRQVTNG
jgi:hypothetical protein